MSEREIMSAISKLSDRVEALWNRQEALVRAFDKQTETIGVLSGQMAEMVEWAQTPPSTDLGDTMRELLLGQQNAQGTLVHLGNEVRALPRRVANELELREGAQP